MIALPPTGLYLWAQAPAPDAPKPRVEAQPGNQAPSAAKVQQPAPGATPQSDAQTRIRVNTSLVVLPVTVKDRAGNLVADLQRNDFRVFEDNVEHKIDVFSAEAFPLSMIILIDNDLKQKDANELRTSLDAIVGG